MAKRRNAPALFELLRESNSTRTGQVGNEQMRSQIGAGVVQNSAPRPPGHPAVIAKAKADEQAKTDALKAEQEAELAKAQAKLNPEKAADSGSTSGDLGIEMDGLLAMPEFKAGRAVDPLPEPEATNEAEPESETPAEPEVVAKPVSEPVSQPESKPVSKPVATPKAPKSKPGGKKAKQTKKAETPSQPKTEPSVSKVDVTSEIESKPNSSLPRVVAGAPEKHSAEQVDSKPESPGVESEPKQTDQPSAKQAQQIKVGSKQIEVTPIKLGIFGAFILLLFFAMFVVGSWAGRSELEKEREPQLYKDAERTLKNIDDESGEQSRPIDPLQIARDQEFVPPTVNNEQAEAPAQTPSQTPTNTQPEIEPDQIANVDTRIPDNNYLHLAALTDSEEARRLQIFLAENGIESYIREGPRGGRTVYELITLVGIPSEGWSTSTEKLSHVREIRRLGGIWFNEHGGSIDYSRANQSQWYKAPPR